MLRQWFEIIPVADHQHVNSGWLMIAVCGAIAGLVLWVAGARFSRLLIGLAAVSIGGAIGMALPRCFDWNISGSGPAVGLALALGVSGYLMERVWIGTFLGLTLAAWAFLVTWVACGAPEAIHFSAASARDWWNALPPNVTALIPYSCGSSFVCGFLLALIWPRLGIATAWSTAGVSLLAALGSAAMAQGRPEWLLLLPQHLGPQLACILFLVTIGIVLQWRSAGRLVGLHSAESCPEGAD